MTRTLAQDKCSAADYRRLFSSSADELRWLCYTLTGDDELSDKVLDAALEQSLKGAEQVFREWMSSWARRLIIKFCIATVRPSASGVSRCQCAVHVTGRSSVDAASLDGILSQPSLALQGRLQQMDSLPRFVFVLRAMEGQSRRDTSLLLNIDDITCDAAFLHAVNILQENFMETNAPSAGSSSFGIQPPVSWEANLEVSL